MMISDQSVIRRWLMNDYTVDLSRLRESSDRDFMASQSLRQAILFGCSVLQAVDVANRALRSANL